VASSAKTARKILASVLMAAATRYLHINYADLVDRILQGGSDEEVLA
jgi:hypothetical protein